MRVLILGGAGMAGHMIRDYFSEKPSYQVFYTTRNIFDENGIFLNINNANNAEEVIEYLKPDLVINCIGLLNQFAGENPLAALQANSILPHQLEKLLSRQGGKLVHISTDCVFSGKKGRYTEADAPDGTSFYAQSKRLGEIHSSRHLTIRTSIIGPELKDDGIGLFSWFMNQSGEIKGYEKVIWNGVTTLELAKAIEFFVEKKTTGLYHLGSPEFLSKNELLLLIQRIFHKTDVKITPDTAISLDRTILSTRSDIVYPIPSYETMLSELKQWMERHE